ncbi:MAG: hypothetical protein NTY64_24035 [Deltaproteobacteria bacterium]|nr:hypothetical protein [Deltaproteobacteria bacterium]
MLLERGFSMASHDNPSINHVLDAATEGMGVCEFRTAMEAANGPLLRHGNPELLGERPAGKKGAWKGKRRVLRAQNDSGGANIQSNGTLSRRFKPTGQK